MSDTMATAIVTLCADEYRPASDPSDALAEIWIDSVLQGEFPIQATQGQAQAILCVGSWIPSVVHKIVVFFKNDAYGGNPTLDRNLYLLGVTFNGVFYPPPAANGMMSSNSSVEIDVPVTAAVPPVIAATTPPPTGIPGTFTPLINATFGTTVAGATITNRETMFTDLGAYPWYIYGPADTNPSRPGPNNAYQILGPVGDGTDGLYENYVGRHAHFAPNAPQDVHVLTDSSLILKAWCGYANGNPNDCTAPNVVGGMLRFIPQITPGSCVEIRCKMPVGMYAWPAFWLNTGVQEGWLLDGVTPGAVDVANWTAEIDVFDQYGFNGTLPGHYLIAGDPTPDGNPADYALPGQTGPIDLPPTFVDIPNLINWTGGQPGDGWYAHPIPDLTADFHTYSLNWGTDGTLGFYLDGVLYRTRGYVWPASAPAAHLIASLQIGACFNDLTGMTPQGGVANGWDWEIQYIRAWKTA